MKDNKNHLKEKTIWVATSLVKAPLLPFRQIKRVEWLTDSLKVKTSGYTCPACLQGEYFLKGKINNNHLWQCTYCQSELTTKGNDKKELAQFLRENGAEIRAVGEKNGFSIHSDNLMVQYEIKKQIKTLYIANSVVFCFACLSAINALNLLLSGFYLRFILSSVFTLVLTQFAFILSYKAWQRQHNKYFAKTNDQIVDYFHSYDWVAPKRWFKGDF